MNTRTPISYRPSIERDRLEGLIKKLHYKAINRFIDEAVKEKLNRELVVTSDPEMTRLIGKLTEAVYEHKGWKFLKPSREVIRKINQKSKSYEEGKVKATRWNGSFDKTFKLKPTPELIKAIDKKADDIHSGKVKGHKYKGSLKDFLKEQ